jgi:hypothetical protein
LFTGHDAKTTYEHLG